MIHARWQDLIVIALGCSLAGLAVLSPALDMLSFSGTAEADFGAAGLALAAIAVLAFWARSIWQDWAYLLLALWLMASSWVLGLPSEGLSKWIAITFAFLLAIVASSAFAEESYRIRP